MARSAESEREHPDHVYLLCLRRNIFGKFGVGGGVYSGSCHGIFKRTTSNRMRRFRTFLRSKDDKLSVRPGAPAVDSQSAPAARKGTDSSVRPARMLPLVLIWLIPSVILLTAFTCGWNPVWRAVGVPSLTPYFIDVRVITSGLVTLHNGGDPLVSNPFDPMNRTLNYPRIWLALFSLSGINDQNVAAVGIGLSALFLLCVSHMIINSSYGLEAWVVLIAALSIAPLFAIERGNTDLLIFSLVYFGCVTRRNYLRPLTFAIAAVLKIYPFVAMIVDLIRRPLKKRTLPIITASLVVGVFLWQLHDLDLIRHSTPISSSSSFGVVSIVEQAKLYAARFGLPLHQLNLFGLPVRLSCWLIACLFVVFAWFKPIRSDEIIKSSPRSSEMFTVFGALYAFCFAVGSNWDYRLILLIPTLPFALSWARNRRYRFWSMFILP